MNYPGGKSSGGMYQWIINQIPPHKNFISGFLGNCPVFRNMPSAGIVKIGFEISQPVITRLWTPADIAFINYESGWDDAGTIVNFDFMTWFHSHFKLLGPETFIYLDPPYLRSSLSCNRKYYAHVLTEKDHIDLLTMCAGTKACIAISHYAGQLYDEMLSSWRKETRMLRIRTGMREEALYMNYPPPTELHTYKFFGDNFTLRQMYKRRAQAYARKLSKMTPLQRSYFNYLVSEALKQ